ncbi:MAG: hypothetical protein IJH78_09190 [Clostridia bacterium]|nr:hypothetical protein [Clostridia bacterium]
MARARAKTAKVSFWNWVGTLILCSIPGVNLIAIICFLIFCKNPSKRSFAAAALVLMLLCAIACVVLLVLMPEQISNAADWLREFANRAPGMEPLLP